MGQKEQHKETMQENSRREKSRINGGKRKCHDHHQSSIMSVYIGNASNGSFHILSNLINLSNKIK